MHTECQACRCTEEDLPADIASQLLSVACTEITAQPLPGSYPHAQADAWYNKHGALRLVFYIAIGEVQAAFPLAKGVGQAAANGKGAIKVLARPATAVLNFRMQKYRIRDIGLGKITGLCPPPPLVYSNRLF